MMCKETSEDLLSGSFHGKPEIIAGCEVFGIVHQLFMCRLELCKRFLSGDEMARAEKFMIEKSRDRYILVRGILRYLLAKRLDIQAGDIVFTMTEKGRPFLDGASGGPFFNVTHTDGMSLIAIHPNRPVGIDLEKTDRIKNFEAIAASMFTDEEKKQWNELPGKQKYRAFYTWWVQKEAYLKYLGDGIGGGLKNFSVDIGHGTKGGFTGFDRNYADEPCPAMKVWSPADRYLAGLCCSIDG